MDKKKLDIIGIGDTVVDAFIHLEIGTISEVNGQRDLCIPFATKIPYESVTVVNAVGNSANAVVSAARLGLNAGIITFLGYDRHGEDCLNQFKKENIVTDFIKQEEDKQTNYHYALWKEDDRTILIKHEHFTYSLPDIGTPKWIYLSSLGESSQDFHVEISNYLEKNPDVKLAFQPGTYQMKFGTEALSTIYKRTEVFIANVEEIQGILKTEEKDIKKIMDMTEDLGPKIILITDGPAGSYMKANGNYYNMPVYPDNAKPVERTGAGDAYASTFVSHIIKGMPPEEAILRAPINSMNVVQYVGAQAGLLSENEIEHYLKNAPESYKLKNI